MATSAPYTVVETLGFQIANDSDNARDSVVEVTNFELFSSNAQPASNGAFDSRMGTTDHHFNCTTCYLQRKYDPGHPGRLRLRAPVVSPMSIPEYRRWLRSICLTCGHSMVDLKKFETIGPNNRLAEASKSIPDWAQCSACGAVHPKINKTIDDNFSYEALYATAPAAQKTAAVMRVVRLYPQMVREIFERVTAATVKGFGRSYHPKDLIIQTVLIPANTIRPGVRIGFGPPGASSHHDLTNMVQYLVRCNLSLPEEMPPQMTKELDCRLQNVQQIYYDMILGAATTNAASSTGRRGLVVGSRSVRSITRSLPRKEGRIRKHLLGKRVWLISRSTISGNPQLGIDEIGYPQSFAETVQVEETVQEYNRDRLMVYFLNGEKQYPGCSRVVKRATGAVHRVSGLRRDFQLEIGDKIERDVVTGDFGYFNRAPSLERSSIGVHRIVVLEDPEIHTFQMNVVACSWYNADFDGDQMNFWVPHTMMARVEAKQISHVANSFISMKSSAPVVGQVQDSVVGSFELTRATAVMDKYHAMRLFAATRTDPPDFNGLPEKLSGWEVVSLLFALTPVNYNRPPWWFNETLAPYVKYNPLETRTEMKRGRLVSGVFDKSSVGAGAGGIFHLISREFGARKALDMIYALQQMAIGFIGNCGFSVGVGDMTPPPGAAAEIHGIIAGVLRESQLVTERLIRGELIPPIGMTTHEYYEALQREALKTPDELLRPIVTSINPDLNGLYKMIMVGSKGSRANLIHIMGAIGQIEINNQRIAEQFSFRRTSVYFPRFATSPEAFGFVKNSYVSGMTGPEFIFSDMNGRYDLINKALSTASTGYANRKAVMALESKIVDNYRRLMNDTQVVQAIYGQDGLDPRAVERVKLRTVFLSDAELAATCHLDLAAAGIAGASKDAQDVFDEAFALIRDDRDAYRVAFLRFEDSDFSTPMDDTRQLPVNVARLVRDVKIARESSGKASSVVHDATALVKMSQAVSSFCAKLPYVFINEIQERKQTPIPPHLRAATVLFQMLIRTELCGPILLGLTPEDLVFILDAIRLHYSRALIEYGTAAGILAAQAVSEPLTQYMLDSHHRSVGGGTNKSGIIRPAEIFGAKPVEAELSPEMLLRVLPEFENDRSEVLQIANQIELLTFDRFVSIWDLLLEAYGTPVYPSYLSDRGWIEEFARNHPLLAPPGDLTNWCVRLELNKASMILKSMSLDLIVERLRAQHPMTYIVHTPENAPRVVVRIYFRALQFRQRRAQQDEERLAALIADELLPTTIRGVPRIMSTSVVELKRHRLTAAGGVELVNVYAIKTQGTNIYGVLLNRRIDPRRIVSSSIGDTEKIFGVVAARNAIVREIRQLMGNSAPNIHHLLLYADEMTRTGRVTSLEKGGISVRERNNVFLRMATSAPTQVLQDAAASNTSGRVYGVSPYLMLGRAPHLGTLWNDFSMDEDYVRANRKNVDSVLDDL